MCPLGGYRAELSLVHYSVGIYQRVGKYHGLGIQSYIITSWGTKERFWLTLAPENNTANLYMVEKVIIWGI